jgi:alpha-N-acetylglucosamine transferase
MSYQSESSKLTAAEEEHLLEAMIVKIRNLDLLIHQNLYSIQYKKLHILDLLEYNHVICMNGNALLFCPMDYLFNLSEPL